MSLALRNTHFKRSHSREKSIGDIFNQASTGLNSLKSLALTLFFTPALIATSVFSQEIVLMLVNITLCFGNLTNFCYRIYKKDIGPTELVLTLLVMALFISGACLLFPSPFALTSALGILTLVNQVAVGINLFFLMKNSLIPPLMSILKQVSKQVGLDIQEQYIVVNNLTCKNDHSLVNVLMQQQFNHAIDHIDTPTDLKKVNTLLQILCDYYNKYEEAFLGEYYRQDEINTLKTYITQITIKGSCTTSYGFINRKLAFKEAKIIRLEKAKEALQKADALPWQTFRQYCKGVSQSGYEKQSASCSKQAVRLIDTEIERQNQKINRLASCLP